MTNAILEKIQPRNQNGWKKSKGISLPTTTINYSDFAGVAGVAGFVTESVL